MLAKIAPATNDFQAIARYFLRGKPGTTPHPDRVAWTFAQNLPTDDPELAATYMAATASLSPRTRNAAYHVMIAWHQREHPSADVMQAIARQTLDLAGLAEHQALIMGHGDKPHRHLHMLINRVHPDTGRAWKTSHDFARFDRIMQQLSAAYGFDYKPAHRFNPDATEHLPKQPNSAATYAAKHGAPTRRLQWSRANATQFGDVLAAELTPASTWDDLEMAVASHGLTLERKGRGYVVGNDVSYAKLSSLGLAITAKDYPRTRAALYMPTRRHVFTVDEIDIVRAFVLFGLLERSAIAEAVSDKLIKRQQRACRKPEAKHLQRALRQALVTTCLRDRDGAIPAARAVISADVSDDRCPVR